MQYNLALDCLRGLAVTLVVIFHSNIKAFSNGYIGVDVFFVLSGFLISGTLLDHIVRSGHVPYSIFYTRRIKRLFIESFLVLTTVTIVCFYIYPIEFVAQHQSWFSAPAYYIANWYYISEATDYWNQANGDTVSPTLHYWSLSVEEQFYCVFPVYIYTLSKIRFPYRVMVSCFIISISLLYCMFLEPRASVVHMSTFTRVYQFGFGMLVMMISRRNNKYWVLEIICPCGIHSSIKRILQGVMICLIIFFSTAIPSYVFSETKIISFMVSVVTAGFLWSLNIKPQPVIDHIPPSHAEETRISPLVELVQIIGIYSYGVYLWHWPLTVFLSPYLKGVESLMVFLCIFCASMGLSILSKKFSDYVFSHIDLSHPKTIKAVLASGIVIPVVFALVLHISTAIVKINNIEEQTNMLQTGVSDIETKYKELAGRIETNMNKLNAVNHTVFTHKHKPTTAVVSDKIPFNATEPPPPTLPTPTPTPTVLPSCTKETIYGTCRDEIAAGTMYVPPYPAYYETLKYQAAKSKDRPKIAMVGDSFTLSLSHAFMELSKEFDFNYYYYSSISCPMLTGPWQYTTYHGKTVDYIQECTSMRQHQMFEQLAAYHPDILFVYTWSWYEEINIRSAQGKKLVMGDPLFDQTYYTFRRAFLETVFNFTKTLIFIAQTPVYDMHSNHGCPTRGKGCTTCDHIYIKLNATEFTVKEKDVNLRALRDLGHYLNINDILCPCEKCPSRYNNINVMRDNAHVAPEYFSIKRYELLRKMESVGIDVKTGRAALRNTTIQI